TTPIRGGGVSRVRIVGNRMWDLAPIRSGAAPDHFDFIHLWTNVGEPAPAAGVEIRDNLMDQAQAPGVIAINLEDNGGGGFPAAVVAGNRIISGANQGIRPEHLVGGEVTDNVLLQ